jgi:beta-N-acetylhexosaminidase
MPNDHITASHPLEKKLYQLIISRLDGEDIRSMSSQERIFELVRKGIGGFLIFGGRRDEARDFIDKIQSISEIPLFIASDVERGVEQQIRDTTLFPCQMAMAAAIDRNRSGNITILESAVKAIADEAKDVGINMPLIPVLDVNQNPDNPIICTRAFSDNPEDVAWFGSEYIRILESSGLINCAKHFPGHGDTSVDSHILLPVINKSYEDLMNIDIVPFKDAINRGVSSIMIGHLSIPVIDNKPASLSGRIITNILREELGFDGLILTDALNMNALKDIENVPVQCINAGADILLHPVDPDLTVKELMSAVETNVIGEQRIEDAVNRILKVKKKINYDKQQFSYEDNERLSSLITEMSITIVKDTGGALPISRRSKPHLVFSGDNKFFESSPLKNYFSHVSMINENLISSFPSFKKLNPTPPFAKGGVGGLLRGKGGFSGEITIFAIFTSVAAWAGSSGIDENEKNRINELIRKAGNSIVISFGSPYVLRHFREADLLIAAFEPTRQAQKAVIKCLTREIEFKGRLPVKLNF